MSANGTDGQTPMAPQRPQMQQQATRRKFWGWGLESEGLTASEIEQLGGTFAGRWGIDAVRVLEPPRVDELDLRAPRLSPPASLEAAFSTEPHERAVHTYGRSFRDVVRAFRRDYAHAPDLVAFPRGEDELVSVLEWCSGAGAAAIPFGGGSSVVGGVEPDVGEGYRGTVSVDLRHLAGVLEVDPVSRAARIAGGTLGPALEAQLKPHGLTLRHFPQSFEWSTLGGWIATRSGGHFATLHTPIDEFVEALRVVTPRGVLETRRLPASGAGPSGYTYAKRHETAPPPHAWSMACRTAVSTPSWNSPKRSHVTAVSNVSVTRPSRTKASRRCGPRKNTARQAAAGSFSASRTSPRWLAQISSARASHGPSS